MSKFIRLKYAKLTIILICVVSFVALFALPYVKLDYQFENFFPKGDKELDYYMQFEKEFENDTDFLLIGIKNSSSIYNIEFLSKVDSLTSEIEELKYIKTVASPTNLSYPVISFFGPIQVPYLNLSNPQFLTKDSARISTTRVLINSFISEDSKCVSILIKTESKFGKDNEIALLKQIEKLSNSAGFEEVRIAGKMKGQYYFLERMTREFILFASLSLGLLLVFLYISFRSFWALWVPVTIIVLTVLWLLAFIAAIGNSLNLMTILLPTILFVVGLSDVVHIVEKYLEELRRGKLKHEALKIAYKEIGLATFLTSLTTSIGFLTLLTSTISPIRGFGIYAAIGVFIAFFLSFTLLPAVLLLTKKPKISTLKNNNVFWNKPLAKSFVFLIRNKVKILIAWVVLIGVCIVGFNKVEINNYLLEDWSDEDIHKQDYLFFEENFSGYRPFEMVLDIDTNYSIWDLEVVEKFQEVEDYLRNTYGVGFLISPLQIIRTLNMAQNGGSADFYTVPLEQTKLQQLKPLLDRVSQSKLSKAIISEDGQKIRFSGKMIDFGGKKIKKMNTKLDSFMIAQETQKYFKPHLTGMVLLIDKNNEYLSRNMLLGLAIAFSVVALIMGILFRSFRMIIIALIPNILPLVMIGAVMGYLGIDMKISTSIIFTIAFGIAVDDTIHFMSKLKTQLNKGKSLVYAIKRTYISTGKALIVTTLILCSGFLTLIMSSIASTYYIGLLITLTLFFALLADLFLLPILVLLFYKK
ncbi:MAG: putative RND superfamily exporter protein [Sphingobacteriales bacterium]